MKKKLSNAAASRIREKMDSPVEKMEEKVSPGIHKKVVKLLKKQGMVGSGY